MANCPSEKICPLARRSFEALALFHDDVDAVISLAGHMTLREQLNNLQTIGGEICRQLKDGAKTGIVVPSGSNVLGKAAGRGKPSNRTTVQVVTYCVLPLRTHAAPVFDITAVLIQHRVPLIALGRTAL